MLKLFVIFATTLAVRKSTSASKPDFQETIKKFVENVSDKGTGFEFTEGIDVSALTEIIQQQRTYMEDMDRKVNILSETVNRQGRQIRIMEKQIAETEASVKDQNHYSRILEEKGKRIKKAINSQERKIENMSKVIAKQHKYIEQLECGHHKNKVNLIRKTLNKRNVKAIESRDASEKSSENYSSALSDASNSNLTTILTNQEKSAHQNLPAKPKDENKLLNTNPNLDNPDESVSTPQDCLGVQRRAASNAGIAFTAIAVHDIKHLSTGQTIKMDTVLLNDGSGYNRHTGVFTVPEAGVYFLTFTIDVYYASIMGYAKSGRW